MKERVTQLSMSAFNYELPDDRIAFYPAEPRDSSKLLIYKNGVIEDHHLIKDLRIPDQFVQATV